jgi:hypothetical protein
MITNIFWVKISIIFAVGIVIDFIDFGIASDYYYSYPIFCLCNNITLKFIFSIYIFII